MKAALPANEQERLEALYSYAILDTLAEGAYDDITEVATQIAGSPIGLVSLVDANRQWFKSKVGLAASETPRELAFCAHAILTPDEPLIVPDATRDPRFADNQLVLGDPAIRFYMGAPLVTPDGKALRTLCVIDRVPRQMTQAQVSALMALSRQVVAQLELRRHAMELRKAYAERELYLQQLESYQEKLELANAVYQEKSLTDRLTGLRNRAALDERLAEEIDRAARYKSPLSLLLLDVDRFKVYNDTHGHIAGDDLLRLLAAELRGSVRPRRVSMTSRHINHQFSDFCSVTPAVC